MANDGFWRYAKLAAEGTAGSEIRQIQLAHYPETELILDSEGKLWYGGESFFDRYNIRYFDSFYVTNAGYEQLVAGVTEEGTVVYRSAMSMDGKPEEIEGLENVKYVDVFWDDIAAVREDGTVVFISGDDRIELEDWSDIAMVYVDGSRDDYTEIIGLKKDGTITAKALVGEPSYPEEILSWTDIVHVIRGNDYVAGLKSDGSFVYALEEDASEYSINHCKETFEVWTNVIAAGEDAAITADREALGDARLLSFGWNLKIPLRIRRRPCWASMIKIITAILCLSFRKFRKARGREKWLERGLLSVKGAVPFGILGACFRFQRHFSQKMKEQVAIWVKFFYNVV